MTCSIFCLKDNGWESDFLEGLVNPKLASLGIDSLAIMEICVAIENDLGLSLVPSDLAKIRETDVLIQKILAHSSAQSGKD